MGVDAQHMGSDGACRERTLPIDAGLRDVAPPRVHDNSIQRGTADQRSRLPQSFRSSPPSGSCRPFSCRNGHCLWPHPRHCGRVPDPMAARADESAGIGAGACGLDRTVPHEVSAFGVERPAPLPGRTTPSRQPQPSVHGRLTNGGTLQATYHTPPCISENASSRIQVGR